MTPLKFHRCAVLGSEPLQHLGCAYVKVTACPAIGMQQGYMAAISLLELIQPAVRAQLQPSVQIEKISLAGQVTLPLVADGSAVCKTSSPVLPDCCRTRKGWQAGDTNLSCDFYLQVNRIA